MARLPVHTLRMIPDGDAGTRATLNEIRSIIRTWRASPIVLQAATELARQCPGKDWACEARVLHAFVRDRVRYQQDIREVETLRTPDVLLRERAGDCDDMVILLGSLLEALGHPVRIVAVGFQVGGPFSHVLLETKIGAQWIPAECTEPWPLGAAPPGVARFMTVHV